MFQFIEQVKVGHKLDIHNVPGTSQLDMQQLYNQARALVYPSVLESFGLPLIEAARACVVGVKMLIKAVDVPTSLKACGVEEKDLEAVAERAVWNVSLEANPRPLNLNIFLDILKKAYLGW